MSVLGKEIFESQRIFLLAFFLRNLVHTTVHNFVRYIRQNCRTDTNQNAQSPTTFLTQYLARNGPKGQFRASETDIA